MALVFIIGEGAALKHCKILDCLDETESLFASGILTAACVNQSFRHWVWCGFFLAIILKSKLIYLFALFSKLILSCGKD